MKSIKSVFFAYITVLLAFAVLDGLWLGLIANDWYMTAFAPLLRDTFITWPWVTFYLLYGGAVVFLAISPSSSMSGALARGAALGATAYGTYNLTAYSIIGQWPWQMTWIDWVWGSVATALLSLAGYATTRSRLG